MEKVKSIPYWYHKITLPDGTVTPGWSPICAEKYAIPDDLTGKRVLDIGSWDGYWTWEAIKRGASEVVAIDDFSDNCGNDKIVRKAWDTFDICREAFGFTKKGDRWLNERGQEVTRFEMSVYDIDDLAGKFDVVFFFGTLYHLKHPLLALEKISEICDGELYIESAICDDYSPYKGGLNKGYRDNDMIAEYYPNNEYGNNESNWWCPTLQTLGYMVQSIGFDVVELWRLTENPSGVNQCRGFVYGSKLKSIPENVKGQAYTAKILRKKPKIAAVMSVPRLGFQENSFCVFESLVPLKIPFMKVQGVFWGQSLERGIQKQIDDGADIILTIDYDTVFKKEDLQELIALMDENPEVDALIPVQNGRNGKQALCTVRTKTGQLAEQLPRGYFEREISPIATGHFGLTLIRASALLKMPHPWFLPEPDKEGQWSKGKTDEDIYFWKLMAKSGGKAFLANHVTIGHLELVVTWPGPNFETMYQSTKDYNENGKPKNIWS